MADPLAPDAIAQALRRPALPPGVERQITSYDPQGQWSGDQYSYRDPVPTVNDQLSSILHRGTSSEGFAAVKRLTDRFRGGPGSDAQVVEDMLSVGPEMLPLKGLGNVLRALKVLPPLGPSQPRGAAKPPSRDLNM